MKTLKIMLASVMTFAAISVTAGAEVNKYNERYINTKREKMHHIM